MALNMSRPPAMNPADRRDPCLSFCFKVEENGVIVGSFSEVNGLQAEVEVKDLREGGVNDYLHRLAGPVRYPANLTLKHGLTHDDTLWQWFKEVMQGTISRRDVAILLMDSAGCEQRRWNFRGVYPVKWVGPDLRAGTAEIAVESIEFVHRGLFESK